MPLAEYFSFGPKWSRLRRAEEQPKRSGAQQGQIKRTEDKGEGGTIKKQNMPRYV